MDDKTVMDRKVTLTGGEELSDSDHPSSPPSPARGEGVISGGRGGDAVAPADAELLDAYSRAVRVLHKNEQTYRLTPYVPAGGAPYPGTPVPARSSARCPRA